MSAQEADQANSAQSTSVPIPVPVAVPSELSVVIAPPVITSRPGLGDGRDQQGEGYCQNNGSQKVELS